MPPAAARVASIDAVGGGFDASGGVSAMRRSLMRRIGTAAGGGRGHSLSSARAPFAGMGETDDEGVAGSGVTSGGAAGLGGVGSAGTSQQPQLQSGQGAGPLLRTAQSPALGRVGVPQAYTHADSSVAAAPGGASASPAAAVDAAALPDAADAALALWAHGCQCARVRLPRTVAAPPPASAATQGSGAVAEASEGAAASPSATGSSASVSARSGSFVEEDEPCELHVRYALAMEPHPLLAELLVPVIEPIEIWREWERETYLGAIEHVLRSETWSLLLQWLCDSVESLCSLRVPARVAEACFGAAPFPRSAAEGLCPDLRFARHTGGLSSCVCDEPFTLLNHMMRWLSLKHMALLTGAAAEASASASGGTAAAAAAADTPAEQRGAGDWSFPLSPHATARVLLRVADLGAASIDLAAATQEQGGADADSGGGGDGGGFRIGSGDEFGDVYPRLPVAWWRGLAVMLPRAVVLPLVTCSSSYSTSSNSYGGASAGERGAGTLEAQADRVSTWAKILLTVDFMPPAELPPRPPPALAAALAGGLVPAVEAAIRAAPHHGLAVSLADALLQVPAEGLPQSGGGWPLFQQLLAFAPPAQTAALITSIGKRLHAALDRLDVAANTGAIGLDAAAVAAGTTVEDLGVCLKAALIWMRTVRMALPDRFWVRPDAAAAPLSLQERRLRLLCSHTLHRWLPALSRCVRFVQPGGAFDPRSLAPHYEVLMQCWRQWLLHDVELLPLLETGLRLLAALPPPSSDPGAAGVAQKLTFVLALMPRVAPDALAPVLRLPLPPSSPWHPSTLADVLNRHNRAAASTAPLPVIRAVEMLRAAATRGATQAELRASYNGGPVARSAILPWARAEAPLLCEVSPLLLRLGTSARPRATALPIAHQARIEAATHTSPKATVAGN
eukprot:XP_001701216.1 predicted protein [Chlamydomonas reinhardtii]